MMNSHDESAVALKKIKSASSLQPMPPKLRARCSPSASTLPDTSMMASICWSTPEIFGYGDELNSFQIVNIDGALHSDIFIFNCPCSKSPLSFHSTAWCRRIPLEFLSWIMIIPDAGDLL